MAIDFPTATTVGQTYTDPTSGNTYVVTVVGPPAQWVGSGSSTNLDSTYLRKDASNDPVTGTLTVTPATNVEGLVVTQPVGNTVAALRITNEGTGNSLLVEDAASTDSTPFVIQNDGTTLIGATSAVGTSKLQVTGGVQTNALNDGPLAGTRNRIINGDMRIDQRATAVTASNAYSVDRWQCGFSSTGAFSASQSTDAPSGYTRSLLFDVTTADTSIAAGEIALFQQKIEGFNISDLAWGTASAKTATLSFWAKSTTTGTYCVSVRNSVPDRSYVAEYTITAANTWEYKTITVPGPTTGSWQVDNTTGILIGFTFMCGTSAQTTANTWATGNFIATSSQTNLMALTTNEMRITGVQFEAGPVATEFERRSYGLELALCQRYYYQTGQTYDFYGRAGSVSASTYVPIVHEFPVLMRVAPTYSAPTATFSSSNASIVSNNLTTRRHLSIMGLSNTPNLDCYFILSTGSLTWSAEL